MSRRIVITGLGSVSALGIGAEALWKGLLEGRSALRPMTQFDASGFPCRVAGEVAEFAVKDFVPKSYRKATKVMARDTELAVGAAKLAVEDSGLTTRGTGEDVPESSYTYKANRLGCNIGAGLIAAEAGEMGEAMVTACNADGSFSLRAWGGGVSEGGGSTGMDALTPLWLLKYLPNMPACHVTIIHGAEGPSNTITCSEASGLLSIGESMRIIERNAADICFSGSAESKLNPMGMLRMDMGRRMAHTSEAADGSRVVRPYDPNSEGGVIGEGAGIVMLECAESAAKRGAKVYAEALGFGGGQSDAFYKDGENDEGSRYAIENALEDAGITADQVSCIVPQATGIPFMDRAEAGAFRAVFGSRLAQIPLVTIQPNIGNCVAGASGLQMVVGALCLKDQMLPARIHHGTPMQGMDAGAARSRTAKLEYALLTSGSLGGQNAAVVLKAVS